MQIIDRSLRIGGRLEDRPLVVLQHLQLSAAVHNAKEHYQIGRSPGFLATFLRIISQRVEPGAGGRRLTESSFARIIDRDALFSFLPIAA